MSQKVSVLMSAYNGEKYIISQLDSLLRQTRAIDEVVIVDDASTDSTASIILDYIDSHGLSDSWRLFVNKKNRGWRANFIGNISRTSGDILFFCDQDDIWFDNKVEVTSSILEDNPDIEVAASRETLWSGGEAADLYVSSDAYDIIELGDQGQNYLINCSGCTMAVRRTYIDRVIKYKKALWAHDDFFWKLACVDGKFALIRESTILHRIHDSNESRKLRDFDSSLKLIKLDIIIARQLLRYIDENSVSDGAPKRRLIIHKIRANRLRLEFLETKNPVILLRLAAKYPDIYRRKRQIAGDFFLAYGIMVPMRAAFDRLRSWRREHR